MRARWLKPEFFRDKKIAALGPVTALVYQALWVSADDSGVAPADPEDVHSQMFARWTAVGLPEVTAALRQLYTAQRITFYQRGDDLFALLVKFHDHQAVHNPSKFRNLPNIKTLDEVVPEWCGSPAAGQGQDSPPRHLDTQTPRHLDTPLPAQGAGRGVTRRKEEGRRTPEQRKPSWMTPYFELWAAQAGAVPAGRMAAALAQVHQEVGPERLTAALGAYLAAGKAALGVEVFARSWRDWEERALTGHLSERERQSKRVLDTFDGGAQ